MIIITGSAVIRHEHREQAIALAIEHSARSRAEPGCLAHNCHIDAEDPDRIVFVEEWESMDAVRVHFAVPESGAFVQALRAMALTHPDMHLFTATRIPTPLG